MKLFRYLTLAIMVALSISACTDETIDNTNTPDVGGNDFVLDETKSYPLVSSNPDIILAETTETVTIILNGKGTAIENFSGDMYAHTGVLTDKSTSSSNWKYTKAGWTENKPECKLKKHSNNLWTLTIKGGPRAYYKVPATEKIKALAFVFRGDLDLFFIQKRANGNGVRAVLLQREFKTFACFIAWRGRWGILAAIAGGEREYAKH